MSAIKPFWYCDKCGEQITDSSDGWLEWVVNYENVAGRLRLVHHRACCQSRVKHDAPIHVCDDHLTRFLGADGLVDLCELALMYRFENAKDLLVMVMRLHVPGYEQARIYFKQALEDDLVHVNSPAGVYSQQQIRLVLSTYAPEQLKYASLL